ncbi:hypothetical protein ABZV77_15105 [Streptomyces sp. NPDC004732]|uniref:hypothetical protein n=1 Tax=Streptomyces sp. NPDC004732 TaxID=3154290 RepID=UPI0033BAE71B
MGVNKQESGVRAGVSEGQVADAKERAARLLLAFRHGNQLAYDTLVEEFGADEPTTDLISALCWIANEGVRKAYLPEAGDRVLRHMARRADPGDRSVLTEEGAGPDAARLLEAIAAQDVTSVQEIVRRTPDTTFLLGKFVLAFAMVLPEVPEPVLREVVEELRGE